MTRMFAALAALATFAAASVPAGAQGAPSTSGADRPVPVRIDAEPALLMASDAPPPAPKDAPPTGRATATATFLLELDPAVPASFEPALRRAADQWAQQIVSPVAVDVLVVVDDLPGSAVASGGSTYLWANTNGVERPDTFYPDALANTMAGTQLDPDAPDIVVVLDSDTPFSLGEGSDVEPSSFDLESVALRQISVGLGVGTSLGEIDDTTAAWGLFDEGWPTVIDLLLEDEAGTRMLDQAAYPNAGPELHDLLVGRLFADGPTIRRLAGDRIEMATPDPPDPDVSGVYLDEDAIAPEGPDAFFTPEIAGGEVSRVIGPAVLGLLADLGWAAALPATVPGPPTEVHAAPGRGTAHVRWTPSLPPVAPITESEVQVGLDGPVVRAPAGATSVLVEGLARTDPVAFRVRNRNVEGWGPWSAVSPPVVPDGAVGPAPVSQVADTAPWNLGLAMDGAGRTVRTDVVTGPEILDGVPLSPGLGAGVGVAVYGADGALDWAFTTRGEAVIHEPEVRIDVAPDGDVVVAARYSGTMLVGPGVDAVRLEAPTPAASIAVIRFAPDGAIRWARNLVAPAEQYADLSALAVDDDAVLVGGRTPSNLTFGSGADAIGPPGGDLLVSAPYVARLDGSSGVLLSRVIATANGYLGRIEAVPGGSFASVVLDGPGGLGGLDLPPESVVRLDDGLVARQHWALGDVEGFVPLADGGAVVVGWMIHASSLVLPLPGGPTTLTDPSERSTYVARLTPGGVVSWATFVSGVDLAHQPLLVPADAPDGEVVLTGSVSGPTTFGREAGAPVVTADAVDTALARLDDSTGEVDWLVVGGGVDGDFAVPAFVRNGMVSAVVHSEPPASFGSPTPVPVVAPREIATWELTAPSAPGIPTGVTAVADDRRATISWEPAPLVPAAPVRAYVVTASTGATVEVPAGQTSVTFGEIVNGTPVTFTVSAVAVLASSGASAPSAPVVPAAVPTAPRSVRARGGAGSVTATWEAPVPFSGLPVEYEVAVSPGGSSVVVTETTATITGLADGVPVTVSVRARNAVGAGPEARSGPVVPGGGAPGPGYHSISPLRLVDTRRDVQGAFGPKAARSYAVPPSFGMVGATAVVLSVVAVGPSDATHLTVWPGGVARPTASSLNTVQGRTIANLVTVPLGPGATFQVFNNAGSTHVIVDVMGWYDDGSAGAGGARFVPVSPTRVLDTRKGMGTLAARFGPRVTRSVDVTDTFGSGVPVDGVEAVVLNLTAVGASEATHLTVWASGRARPDVSNLNVDAGWTLPNLVVSEVGADGRVQIRNNTGNLDVLADVVGYFTSTGEAFHPVSPVRVLDTRSGRGAPAGRVGAKEVRVLDVTDTFGSGVPSSGVEAVILNVTAVGASDQTHITVWPTDRPRPNASNLNVASGWTVPNLVTVKVAPDGTVSLFNNSGEVDLVADVVGWYG